MGSSKVILSPGLQYLETDTKLPASSNANSRSVFLFKMLYLKSHQAKYTRLWRTKGWVSPGFGRRIWWPFNDAFAPSEYVHRGILNFKVGVPPAVCWKTSKKKINFSSELQLQLKDGTIRQHSLVWKMFPVKLDELRQLLQYPASLNLLKVCYGHKMETEVSMAEGTITWWDIPLLRKT